MTRKNGSVMADSLQVGGQRAAGGRARSAHARDHVSRGVRARRAGFSTTCRSCRATSSEGALKDGTFRRAWGLATPPGELVGLGPFLLKAYEPGQRLRFERNPRYWRKDANGAALPYLDRITIEIVPDQNTELLRLEAGQLDMTTSEMRPEDYAPLKLSRRCRTRQDLRSSAPATTPTACGSTLEPGRARGQRSPCGLAAARRASARRFRWRSIGSCSRTRCSSAPACRCTARSPRPTRSGWPRGRRRRTIPSARARRELSAIGLTDRNGDGLLSEDAAGRPRTICAAGRRKATRRSSAALAVIRDELKKIGLTVDVVLLEGNAVIERFLSGTYEAAYFRITPRPDTDPAINPDFLVQLGGRARLESRAADAGHRLGTAHRRLDAAADHEPR